MNLFESEVRGQCSDGDAVTADAERLVERNTGQVSGHLLVGKEEGERGAVEDGHAPSMRGDEERAALAGARAFGPSVPRTIGVLISAPTQLTGPMLTAFLLDARATVNTLASVTFNPFSWALSGIGDDDALGSTGWLDVTEWLLYEDDREAHDLRFLTPRGLPVTPAVLHQPSNQGMQMYSAEITPIFLGRLPGYRPSI
ncbi:hypothetical protein ACIQTT_06865 [Microbacterium sp. NPDC090225]|uniref:hypothetical protein n=1 Tax=Microbacterium sp. NPDC090225 TaxID=3364207 RepID=UPI003820BD64